jgi:hypothetical protein
LQGVAVFSRNQQVNLTLRNCSDSSTLNIVFQKPFTLVSTTTKMILSNQNQLLEVFGTLDQQQANQVLAYAKQLINREEQPTAYKQFKREAMRQIRQALQKEKGTRTA